MTTAASLTPEYLTGALASMLGGAKVTDVDAELVGTGQMGVCVRLVPTYDTPGAGPASLVAKLPAVDETSRATAAALRNYEIEVNFYRHLVGTLRIRTPRCYHAEIDLASTDFVLLLEDIALARPGDQLAGCSVDEAALAVRELPKLHGPRWGDTRLEDLDWLHRTTEASTEVLSLLIGAMFPGFCERYQDRLDPDVIAVAQRLVVGLAGYQADRPGPWTVAHGDYRLDNLLFGPAGAQPSLVVVDWQTVGYGPGISDLSYFLGAGLLPEARRKNERDLVRSYHEGMRAAGVDLAWDDVWSQYRRYTFDGLIMAIAASMLVARTERGDDMFITMAQRHGRHALDLEATDFIS